MQFILVHWKNHTLHEADRPYGYELDDANSTLQYYTSIQYLIVLLTTFLSHSSKHAPRLQMPHALYFLHLTACTT